MAHREIAAQTLLAALPMFKALAPTTLARLAEASVRRPLRRGERIFARGEAPAGLYVVVHGEIQLVARSGARGTRMTGIVGPGQSFGEAVMFLERPAVVDALAATDALVLLLPKQAVFDEIDRNPRFARLMIANLARRVERLVQDLDRQAQGGGRARLADYLLRQVQAQRAGQAAAQGEPPVVALPSTKAAVASHLNLTPEHFSRLLHELAAAGLLRVERRRIVITDLAGLDAQRRSGFQPG